MARKLQPGAITLDLGLSDIDGFVLLDLLKHDPDTGDVPVHVISGADHCEAAMGLGAFGVTEKPAEEEELSKLFATLLEKAKKPSKRRRGKKKPEARLAPRKIPELAGTKVLIVDDDIRNIFSLTSVLETHDVEVFHAERGREGIDILEHTPGIHVALIDIMMPEMDGYETMQEIRRRPEIGELPLIAVTAKAMKGDRQKCLDAGASDYIAKPVDIDLLLALLRVWVSRSRETAQTGRSVVEAAG
jgi:CheY-like chemotaxis protein